MEHYLDGHKCCHFVKITISSSLIGKSVLLIGSLARIVKVCGICSFCQVCSEYENTENFGIV